MQDVHNDMLHAFKAHILKKQYHVNKFSQSTLSIIDYFFFFRLLFFIKSMVPFFFINKIIIYANKSIMHVQRELY